MKKFLLLYILLAAIINAAPVISPAESIHVDGNAKDLVVHQPYVYIGTSRGKLQVYNLQTKQLTDEVSLPKIKDFMGDEIFAAAASIDCIEDRYLLLSDSGDRGYTDLWIHESGVTKKIISSKDKMTLVKARFIDKDHVLLGFLSNEAALFEISTHKTIYRVQLNESKFSDFALNTKRTQAAYGCESGEIFIVDTHTGKVLNVLKGINKDNVYKVDFKNTIVSGAGQDRRASYYSAVSGRGGYFPASFLIYATGLSPSASKVAFALDENNNITVFDMRKRVKIATLKGQHSTLNAIVFVDENTIVSGSDDDNVLVWKLP